MRKSFKRYLGSGNLLLVVSCVAALWLLEGCASTEVVQRKRLTRTKLARPGKILIYDFVVNQADVPSDSALSGRTAVRKKRLSPQEVKIGRTLGAIIASRLVKDINAMGIKAVRGGRVRPRVNDIVLRGYLLSIVQGEGMKRVVVGFGYGAAELKTFVEGYQMTGRGLRKLGSAVVAAGGNKTPGGALGALTFLARANPIGLIVGLSAKGYGELSGSSKVEGMAKNTADKIAEELKKRFREEGWIN
jgi:hypothetical protein